MGVYIDDNKLVIIAVPKLFILIYIKTLANLKHEINISMNCNEYLAEHTIKKR